jgi:hypothetical protein
MAPFAAAYAARGAASTEPNAVGVIGLDAPFDILTAAGLRPVPVVAEPTSTGAAAFAEGAGHPGLRGLAAALTEGPYRHLRRLVVGTTPSNLTFLAAFLQEARALGAGFADLDVHLFDFNRNHAPSLDAARRGAMEALRARAEAWSGRRIADGDLAAAIAGWNRVRAGLAQVQAAREGGAARLTGVEALTVFGATVALPFDSSPLLIETLLAERTRPISTSPRVYSGSATATLAAYAAIEGGGVTIAADDQDCGSRGLWPEVNETGDPLDALAKAALNRPPPPARTSTAERTQYLLDLVRRTKAQSVIFAIEPFDHPPAWELPTLVAALEAAGVGVKVLEMADV